MENKKKSPYKYVVVDGVTFNATAIKAMNKDEVKTMLSPTYDNWEKVFKACEKAG